MQTLIFKLNPSIKITGARGPRIHELPLLVKTGVELRWERPKLDLNALARKKWVDGWSTAEIARYYERHPETIRGHLRKFCKDDFKDLV